MTGVALGTLLVLSARLRLTAILHRLLVVNSFTVFLWLTLPLTYPGTETVAIGPVAASLDGITMAALITLKTNGIILLSISLLSTSSIADLGHAMAKLRLPSKLCLLLLFSYRYIFVIHQEYQRLLRAATLRGFTPSTTMHTYRTYSYLFAMTLLKSWHRASRVGQAMILRGFSGRFYTLNDTTLCVTDLFFTATMVATSIGLWALELVLP